MKAKVVLSSSSSCRGSSSLVNSFLLSCGNALKVRNLLQPTFVSPTWQQYRLASWNVCLHWHPDAGTFIEQMLWAQHYADDSHPHHLIKCAGIVKEWAEICQLCRWEGEEPLIAWGHCGQILWGPSICLGLSSLMASSSEMVKSVIFFFFFSISPSSQNITFPVLFALPQTV